MLGTTKLLLLLFSRINITGYSVLLYSYLHTKVVLEMQYKKLLYESLFFKLS